MLEKYHEQHYCGNRSGFARGGAFFHSFIHPLLLARITAYLELEQVLT